MNKVKHNLVPGNHSGGRVSVRIAVFPRSGNLCPEDRTIRTARNLTKTPKRKPRKCAIMTKESIFKLKKHDAQVVILRA